MKLLLASKSPARRRMLEAAGIRFALVETMFDEDAAKSRFDAGMAPPVVAAKLAEAKARSASAPGGSLVLGADQVLERDDGSMLSKPRSLEDARDQLRSLGGRIHHLHSAAAVVRSDRLVWQAIETATLEVRPLGEEFLREYLDREYPHVRSNVGAYRIEGPGIQLFDSIHGSHFAILGLPLLPLLAFLRDQALLAG